MEENTYRSLGRIRRKRNIIREGKDSNLLSTEIVLIKISKIKLLRKNPRENIFFCEKGKTTNPMLGMQGIPYVQGFPS
jgi:hypothetical protein